MIKELKRNLYLVYMITTGLILTVVIVSVVLLTIRQIDTSGEMSFSIRSFNIIFRLQNDSEIKYSWISENELSGDMVIWIEDNGKPLSYTGGKYSETDRRVLAERGKELISKKEGKNLSAPPVSESEYKSGIYRLKGDANDNYYVMGASVKVSGGFRSLVVLGNRSRDVRMINFQLALYFGIYLTGLAALALVCRALVSRSVAPVEAGQKQQKEFIAAASHELRSPLAVIRADVSVMKKEKEYLPKFADSIERECVRMARLTDDMLTLAAADAKNFQVRMEKVDIESLLVDIYEEFTGICGQNGISFSLDLEGDELPDIMGDAERIRQILFSLLNNAIAHSGSARIVLRAHADKGHLVLELEDHGCGIPDEEKEKIFERFYRADRSRGDKSHFGLGLNIAKELLDLHRANLSVRDTEGGGATFVLRF